MPFKTKAVITASLLLLLAPTSALAQTRVPLWVNAHRDAAAHPSTADLAPFTDAAGWSFQEAAGPRWWNYVKSTRTDDGALPERWYLHVNGARVRDAAHPRLYVMNPTRTGWRRHVAAECGARCFLDGAGEAGRHRTTPVITGAWSRASWRSGVAGLIRSVQVSGHPALPNSAFSPRAVRAYSAVTHRVSTEGFVSLADLSILRAGHVWVFGKKLTSHGCGYLLASYLIGRAPGDRFSCFVLGTAPWVVPSTLEGPRVGRAEGRAVVTRRGYRRVFRYAVVRAHWDGGYSIRSR